MGGVLLKDEVFGLVFLKDGVLLMGEVLLKDEVFGLVFLKDGVLLKDGVSSLEVDHWTKQL